MPITLSEITQYLENHSVTNYAALPAANTVSNELWYCIAPQGTAWLPGSLGGTYYTNGWYFSDGINWTYQSTAFEASLSEVNTGTVTDKFVSPNTLANSTWAFTVAKVLATALSGLSLASGGVIASTDTILQAFGKLQYQITNLSNTYLVRANNLSDLSSAQTAKINLNIDKHTTVGDANYNILITDKEVVTSAPLTANRTYTLPTGESAGQEFIVSDEFQALGTYTITVGVATGKKLNGVTNGTVTMVTAGGHRRFFGDGNGNYSFDAGLARLGVSQTFTGTNTFSTAPVLSSLTASQLLATDGSKNVQTLTTATYPSLTELSYAKGVTSAIQTQIDGKLTASNNLSDLGSFITARTTNLRMWDLFLTGGDQSTTSSSASNITDLVSVSLTANKRYKIHGIIHVGCNNTGGVKIQVTIPTGATIFLMTNGLTSGSTVNAWSGINTSATLGAAFCTANSTGGCIMVNGEISIGANAGTIQFGFASGVNTQTSTIYQLGTQIILTQIN